MGDLLSSKSNSQATTNNQIALNAGGTAVSGAVKSSVLIGNNNTNVGGIKTGNNSTIHLVTTDYGAVASGEHVALAALESNTQAATYAINAGLQTNIAALNALTSGNRDSAALIAQVQAGANDVALKATPLQAGDLAAAVVKPLMIFGAIVAIVVLFPKLIKP